MNSIIYLLIITYIAFTIYCIFMISVTIVTKKNKIEILYNIKDYMIIFKEDLKLMDKLMIVLTALLFFPLLFLSIIED